MSGEMSRQVSSRQKNRSWADLFVFPRWRLAAFAVLLLVLGIAGWRIFIYRSEVEFIRGDFALYYEFLDVTGAHYDMLCPKAV
jgi:hypothetical protein